MASRIVSISVRELWPQIVKRQMLVSTNQFHQCYYLNFGRFIPFREKERTLGSVPDDSRGNLEFHPTRPFHPLPRPLVPRRSSAPAYQLKLLWTALCGIYKEMMFLEELIILGTTAVHKSFSWITLKLSYSSEHIRNTYPSIFQYHRQSSSVPSQLLYTVTLPQILLTHSRIAYVHYGSRTLTLPCLLTPPKR